MTSTWRGVPTNKASISYRNGSIITANDEYGVNKFGFNPDISPANDPQDLWYNGGLYTFTETAAPLAIASSSTDDDVGGTGATAIKVEGLDANLLPITEDVTLDGTSTVNTTQSFFRVNRAYNISAGTGGVNAGTITISDGVNTVATIAPNHGQTMSCMYTIQANISRVYLAAVSVDIIRGGNSTCEVWFQTRMSGEAWRTRDIEASGANSIGSKRFEVYTELEPGEDIRMRCNLVSQNSTGVTGKFDLIVLK